MKETLIRRMTEEDVASVIAIEKASFSLPWSEISFVKELYKPRSIAKVAVADDAVVGYVCADFVLDEAHILDLAVHPDYRKRGIAAALVDETIRELKMNECRFVFLEVRASNSAAIKLYKSFGFRVAGNRRDYYVAPVEDAVIMMLEV